MKIGKLNFWTSAVVCSIALAAFAYRAKAFPGVMASTRQAMETAPQRAGTQASSPMPQGAGSGGTQVNATPSQNSQQPSDAEQNPFAQTEQDKSPRKSTKAAPAPPLYKGAIPDPDPKLIAQALDELSFRLIGPASPSGRVWQVVGVPPKDGKGITTTLYICTAGGGVWKSTDAGTTIVPIFNDEGASSCGAVAVAPSDVEQVWVGTGEPASSASDSLGRGVFRSVNGGGSWEFAGLADTEEISAIVIDPKDANTVYVAALGHLWGRNAERGIFKTTDGGKSWSKSLYVDDATGFSDLVMDPHNPGTLYAAAWQRIRWGGGDLVESGPGSGIYKTIDGGTTWTKLTTGLPDKCTYAAMKPLNDEEEKSTSPAKGQERQPELDADAKHEDEERREGKEKQQEKRSNERVDRPSIDIAEQDFLNGQKHAEDAGRATAGASCMGKITLALAQGNSNIVYAAILTGQQRPMPEWISDPNATERTSQDGGVFRSDDGGVHWKRVSSAETSYSQDRIVVDPTNDQRVWMPVFGLLRSQDGGTTFAGQNMAHVHTGLHAIWIDPLDPDHMVLGGDGGVYTTFNGERSWVQQVLPVGQVYKVAVDDREPYWVYAGMEDAGHWAGPSRTYDAEGITDYDWFKLRYRGDGMSIAPDPHDPNIIYMVQAFGNTSRLDLRTWTGHELQPPPSTATKLGLHALRWDLTSPLVILSNGSAESHLSGEEGRSGGVDTETGLAGGGKNETARGGSTTFLLGANYVFRCVVPADMPYYPDSWGEKYCRVISPDLTAQQGKSIEGVQDGYHSYGALSSLAQSRVSPQVMWAGADDGPIWVTRDSGAHWQRAGNVVNGSNTLGDTTAMPGDGVVAHLETSKTGAGAAYAVIDRHTRDDQRPYIYFTKDYGATWKDVTGDLPRTGQAYVVLEDPENAKVLYAGTEFGLYVTLDAGTHWVRWNTDLPTAPIRAMAIQPRDRELVVGTFGRGVYVGDIAPLAQMAEAFANKAFLFNSTAAVASHTRYTYGAATQQLNGDMFFRAQNPSYGMPLYYYLSEPVRAGVRLVVTDAKGALVRSLLAPSTSGFHVFNWDLDWQLQILMDRLEYRSVEERVEHPEILDDELAFTFSERLARRLVPAGTYTVTLYPNDSPSPDEVPAALTVPRKVRVKDEGATGGAGSVRK
jgi:photosystem II stability/assembly factor-like uncharacterized protein